MKNEQKEQQAEGPRSFAVTLQQLADGEAHGELTEALYELLDACTTKASQTNGSGSGELIFKLKIKVDARGQAGLAYEVNTKIPKEKRAPAHMWITAGGNLTPQNPRQQTLDLRSIPSQPTADFDPQTGEVRSL